MTAESAAPTSARHVELADAFFTAEQAITRAGRVVEDVEASVASAFRILDDAELAADRARLTAREQRLLGPAADHLQRLRAQCHGVAHLAGELEKLLSAVKREIDRADQLLDRIDRRPVSGAPVLPETAPGLLTSPWSPCWRGPRSGQDEHADVRDLRVRVALLRESTGVAQPMAAAFTALVRSSWEANGSAGASGSFATRTVERDIQLANGQLGRVEGSVRLLQTVLERAVTRAQESVDAAVEISERARDRMTAAGRRGPPSPTSGRTSPACSRAT